MQGLRWGTSFLLLFLHCPETEETPLLPSCCPQKPFQEHKGPLLHPKGFHNCQETAMQPLLKRWRWGWYFFPWLVSPDLILPLVLGSQQPIIVSPRDQPRGEVHCRRCAFLGRGQFPTQHTSLMLCVSTEDASDLLSTAEFPPPPHPPNDSTQG